MLIETSGERLRNQPFFQFSGVISLANKYDGGRIKWINRGGYVGSDTAKQEQAYAFTYDI